MAFEKLIVYQGAIEFADAICSQSRALPRGYYFLQDQINGAALSIAANLAEGKGTVDSPSLTDATFS